MGIGPFLIALLCHQPFRPYPRKPRGMVKGHCGEPGEASPRTNESVAVSSTATSNSGSNRIRSRELLQAD